MATNKSHRHIGIVIPTGFELAPLLHLWPEAEQRSDHPWEVHQFTSGNITAHIIVSYIGPANAAAATERLITTNHQIEAILHGGAAGAINGDLLPGDIVLGRELKTICSKEILAVRQSLLLSASAIRYVKNGKPVHVDSLFGAENLIALAQKTAGEVFAGGKAEGKEKGHWQAPGWPQDRPLRAPTVSLGCLGAQDGWTKSIDELDYIATTFGVDTEDMESTYVAQIAAKHEIPCLAIRVISNNERVGTLAKNEIMPAISAAAERVAVIISKMVQTMGAE